MSTPASVAAANLKGIAWMVVTGVLFVVFTGIVRHVGSDMNPLQAAFLRYAMGLALLAPVFLRLRARRVPVRRLPLHAIRGVIHGVGVMAWFYAMARIPVADVTALGFTVPIFITIGAALFLGERLQLLRVAAVVAGFGGALIILRPGIEAVAPGAIAQLIAAPLFAGSFIVTKRLTATESNTVIVAYLGVFVTLTLLPGALLVWRTPTWPELGWLFLGATVATVAHLCMTQSFRHAQMTALQPVYFLQLVWATILGFYAFGEEPDVWTWIGAAVVLASATFIAHRESRAQRRALGPAPPVAAGRAGVAPAAIGKGEDGS